MRRSGRIHDASEGDSVAAAIQISHVTKVFRSRRGDDLVAVGDVDIAVSEGEFVALVGPSGCGKSTILRLLAGLEEPTAGDVRLGVSSPRLAIEGHRLGIAFQDHALLPWLNVRQNVGLPMKLAGRPVDRDRVDELIDLVGLQGFESTRPAKLSGGMRQRVSIARALAMEPPFLLLDEPFGALDLVTRRRLNFELERIWLASAPTCVLVTHSVDEAVLLADRVVVLSSRPAQVVSDHRIPLPRPRDASMMHTASFLGLVRAITADLDRVTRVHSAPTQRARATVRLDERSASRPKGA